MHQVVFFDGLRLDYELQQPNQAQPSSVRTQGGSALNLIPI